MPHCVNVPPPPEGNAADNGVGAMSPHIRLTVPPIGRYSLRVQPNPALLYRFKLFYPVSAIDLGPEALVAIA